MAIDQTLNEIRSGRRLGQIVSSIECFLLGQIDRIEDSIEECNRAVENDRILQNILREFELEKKAWEESRQAEARRLQLAGEDLIRQWEELESARRKFLDEQTVGR